MTTTSKKIRVLIVDDSALMRKLLSELLSADPNIEVVGTAMDAYVAREKIKQLNPDVLTLDVEMPKMDGVTFLSNLMRLRPMPVVMISSLTVKGADLTMRALDLGAVDFVSKPAIDLAHSLEAYSEEIIQKIRTAAVAKVDSLARKPRSVASAATPQASGPPDAGAVFQTTHQVIAIGASTGGTEAIKDVLVDLKPDCPGIVIAQHIPPVFSRSFAERMDRVSPLAVCEASDGQQILPGHVYIAPGDRHLEVRRDGARYRCHLHEGEPVNRHRPSVDVLFDSVADHVGQNAIGVILTGMGRDGAKGLRLMRDHGATTIAQDEQSSVIWGMPRAAVEEEGAGSVLPLSRIAGAVTKLAHEMAAA